MANKDKIIKITFEGEDRLSKKISTLDKATRRLIQSQTKLIAEGKKVKNSQEQLYDTLDKSRKKTRILGGTFAVLRSKMLLVNFALGLGIRQLGKFGAESAKVENMERAFTTLAGGTQIASESLSKLKEATNDTMSEFNLFQQANNAMILGVTKNSDEMAEMFDIAQRLGRALGRDTASSVESLITGIGRQSRLMLDNIGIIVKADEAYESYAKKLGITADELTDADKKQAFLTATMESARAKVKDLGDEVLSTQDTYDQLSVASQELAVATGNFLSPALEGSSSILSEIAESIAKRLNSIADSRKVITEETSLEEQLVIKRAKLEELTKKLLRVESEKFVSDVKVKKIEEERVKLLGETFILNSKILIQQRDAKDRTEELTAEENKKLEQDKKALDTFNKGMLAQRERAELQEELSKKHKEREKEAIRIAKEKRKFEKESLEFQKLQSELGIKEIEIENLRVKNELVKDGLSIEDQLFLLVSQREIIESRLAESSLLSQTEQLDLKKELLDTDIARSELVLDLQEQELQGYSDLAGALGGLNSALRGNALVSKRLAQVGAVIDAYAGFNKALAQGGAFGMFTGAAILATGLANVAKIEAQKFEQGGLVGGNRHSQGGTLIEAEQGEFVMSRKAVDSIGVQNLNEMNRGGRGNVTVNISAPLLDETVVDSIIPAINQAVFDNRATVWSTKSMVSII